MVNLFGEHDKNMILIEKELCVEIVVRANNIIIFGEEDKVLKAEELIKSLIEIWRTGQILTSHDIRYAIALAKGGNSEYMMELVDDIVCVTARGKNVRPKTLGQKVYAEAIRNNDIVFGIGPAGTGKTYLAMAMAVSAFKNREVNRIILTRPAVEAGEKLGFLPGDLQEKVDPYLRPLYDALYDIIGGEAYQKYIEKGMIEVAPLAYMRGRTLDDSFIILDEAQNTTTEQMKMFLTRMGFSSKAVITGDITQIDLPKGKYSGLEEARTILKNIKGIEFVYLTDRDVVRHPLVQKIVKAYEEYTQKEE
ncbi:MAG TPA: PhoH family protein [Thermoanaerobacterales bacterium]|nr:PhoH family protein [Thermoanaerobacterales bacterium]